MVGKNIAKRAYEIIRRIRSSDSFRLLRPYLRTFLLYKIFTKYKERASQSLGRQMALQESESQQPEYFPIIKVEQIPLVKVEREELAKSLIEIPSYLFEQPVIPEARIPEARYGEAPATNVMKVLKRPSRAIDYTKRTEVEISDKQRIEMPRKNADRVIVSTGEQIKMPQDMQTLILLERGKHYRDSYQRHRKVLANREEFLRNGYRASRIFLGSYNLMKELFQESEFQGKSILDLGCGSYSPLQKTIRDKKIRADMVGVDMNEQSLRIAKENFPETEYIQALFPHLDFFRNDAFDLVVATNSLHYTRVPAEIRTTLMQLNRLLRKDGKMIIVEPSTAAKEAYNSLILSSLREMGYEIKEDDKVAKFMLDDERKVSAYYKVIEARKVESAFDEHKYKLELAKSLLAVDEQGRALPLLKDAGVSLEEIQAELEKDESIFKRMKREKAEIDEEELYALKVEVAREVLKFSYSFKRHGNDVLEELLGKFFEEREYIGRRRFVDLSELHFYLWEGLLREKLKNRKKVNDN